MIRMDHGLHWSNNKLSRLKIPPWTTSSSDFTRPTKVVEKSKRSSSDGSSGDDEGETPNLVIQGLQAVQFRKCPKSLYQHKSASLCDSCKGYAAIRFADPQVFQSCPWSKAKKVSSKVQRIRKPFIRVTRPQGHPDPKI